MPQERHAGTGNFVGDALASLGIGIWSWRGSPSIVHCCPMAAGLFGVPATAAWNGLPFDRFAARVHAEDRARFADLVGRAQRTGGPFVAEYRTLDETGTTRSLLDRGEFELGPDGCTVAARGMVIDMMGLAGRLEIEHGGSGVPSFTDLPELDQAVEHALALHRLMGVISPGKRHAAEMLLGAVLEILGQEVAESLQRLGYRFPHARSRRNVH